MIGVIFEYGNEIVETRVTGTQVFIRTSTYGTQFAPIESIRFDKEGVLREFPDLKDNPNWREISMERFKEKLKQLGTENKIADYLIEDLKKYGYIPKYKQKQGHRVEAIL